MTSILQAPQAQRATRVLQYYGITIKYIKSDRNPSSEDYEGYIASHSKDIEWGERVYELDNSYPPKLHLHGVVQARKNYYSRKLDQHGFHVYMTPISNAEGWFEYMRKDYDNQYAQEELLVTNDIQVSDYPYIKRGVGVLPREALAEGAQRLERRVVEKTKSSKRSRTINKVQQDYLRSVGLTLKFD